MMSDYLKDEFYFRIENEGSAIFDLLRSAAFDGVWYWDIENPKNEWMCPRFKEVFGYKDEEIENSSEWWQKNIYPEDLEMAINNFKEHCEDSKHPYDQVVRYRHKDGSTVWVRCRGHAIRDEKGKAIRLFGIHTDLTELIRSQQKSAFLLLEAEKLSKTGAWEWSIIDDTWSFSSQWHEIHGTPRRQLSSEELMPIAHPDDREAVGAAFKKSIENGEKYEIEHRIIRQNDGEIRHIRSVGEVRVNRDGTPERIFGAAQDITVDKQVQEQLLEGKEKLEQSNRELMQFSYRTSHDLRAPLTSIKGLAKFILDDIESGDLEEVKRNAKKVADQAATLEKLVLDLLEMAKADLVESEPESIDLQSIVDEVEKSHFFLAEQNGVILKNNVQQCSPIIFRKMAALQILSNLISNGIKYSDKDKPEKFVTTKITTTQNELNIVVEDNGVGIPYDNKADIYNMFMRYHSKNVSGSGLGMYIVKKHVDSARGRIDFSSSPSGTVFKVTFNL